MKQKTLLPAATSRRLRHIAEAERLPLEDVVATVLQLGLEQLQENKRFVEVLDGMHEHTRQ